MLSTISLINSSTVLYVDAKSVEKTQTIKTLQNIFRKVISTDNDKDALLLYKSTMPDIIVTNINLPQLDGIKLIKQLRSFNYHIPIIILTKHDKLDPLLDIANLSVDGYLNKPLDYQVFEHTICRSIKRDLKEIKLIPLGKELLYNIKTRELYLSDTIVPLGNKENQLLMLLIENRYKTVTKEDISHKLSPFDRLSDAALKKLINRLRQKMQFNLIISVRGIGYRLDAQQSFKTRLCREIA